MAHDDDVEDLDSTKAVEPVPLSRALVQSAPTAGATLGQRIGRYLLLEKLGQGGMAVVYKAYDPELDRRVALKLLRLTEGQQGAGFESLSAARARLVREAQALAQVAHPNIVAVHDVGTHDGDVFIAMEYVEGQTLRAWLRGSAPSQPAARPWREVLAVLLPAGEGLAAAHRAGLVHRDFKPENAMLSKDGRVRVLDFGLARAPAPSTRAALAEGGGGPGPGPGPGRQLLDTPLTQVGFVLGTPAYMAPEQHAGLAAGPASDAFSFCVVTYEALYGERPFAGESYEALKANVLAGSVRPAPAGSRVPAHLRRALLKGLAATPEQRYADMSALLAALSHDPRVRRRRVGLAAASAVLVAAAALGGVQARHARPTPCRDAASKLAGIWDDATRKSIIDAFRKSGHPQAAEAASRVSGVLGAHAREWTDMWAEACAATHVRGEQSEALLDLRMRCLRTRAEQLRALTALLADAPSSSVVDRATEAAHALGGLQVCADEKWLTSEVPLPEDPDRRARAQALRERLSAVKALERTGQSSSAREKLQPLLIEAEQLADDALLGEVYLAAATVEGTLGDVQASERALSRSAEHATAARDGHVLSRVWTEQVYLVGVQLKRFEEAAALARSARALSRLTHEPNESGLSMYQAAMATDQGRYESAITHAKQAIEAALREVGPSHPDTASARATLGAVYNNAGRPAEAIPEHEAAIEIWAKSVGPSSPQVTMAMNNLAVAQSTLGEYSLAAKTLRRTVDIREGLGRRADINLGLTLVNLCSVQNNLEAFSEAAATCEEARGILAQVGLPESHPEVIGALVNLGLARARGAAPEGGLALMRRAIALHDQAHGAENLQGIAHRLALVEAYLALGRYDHALPVARGAVATRRKQLGPSDPATLGAIEVLARVLERRGDVGDSVTLLEAALASAALPASAEHRAGEASLADDTRRLRLAELRFALARQRWRLGRRAPALEVARAALDDVRGESPPQQRLSRKVEAWLAAPR